MFLNSQFKGVYFTIQTKCGKIHTDFKVFEPYYSKY